jgi:hypothetical protein
LFTGAEALLSLATGGTPAMPALVPATADPFSHPDAQRRFRVLTNLEELERALDFPWEKWAVFLHPAQRPARRTPIHRTGTRFGIGRHRQDYCRIASRCRSGAPPA